MYRWILNVITRNADSCMQSKRKIMFPTIALRIACIFLHPHVHFVKYTSWCMHSVRNACRSNFDAWQRKHYFAFDCRPHAFKNVCIPQRAYIMHACITQLHDNWAPRLCDSWAPTKSYDNWRQKLGPKLTIGRRAKF